MTSASSWRFSDARCMILLSIVCRLTSRKMSTGLVCPMRCARSCACRSICGFCIATNSILSHTTIRGPYPLMEATHPILVIEHDGVRRGEVDAKPSRTRAQEKEVRCSGLVTALLKTLHLGTTLQRAGRSVDAA